VITIEVCKRSGTDTASCGLAACDNGCDVTYIECVPIKPIEEAFAPIGGVPSERECRDGLEAERGDLERVAMRVARVVREAR
jgi:hypothetical protein